MRGFRKRLLYRYRISLRVEEFELATSGGVWVATGAQGVVKIGDSIVITVGEPIGKAGGTNTMKLIKVGDPRV